MTFHGTIGFGSNNVFSWCWGPPDNPRCLGDFLDCGNSRPSFFLSHFGNLILKVKLQLAITQTPRWLTVIGRTARAHTVKQRRGVWCVRCYQVHWFCMELCGRTGWSWYQKIKSQCRGVWLVKMIKLVKVFHILQKTERRKKAGDMCVRKSHDQKWRRCFYC